MFRRCTIPRRTRTTIGASGLRLVLAGPLLVGVLAGPLLVGVLAGPVLVGPVRAETTPPQPSAAQPVLPDTGQAAPPKPDSPVVEDIVKDRRPAQAARKGAIRRTVSRSHRTARRHEPARALDRPALAGVELVEPLPPPPEPPHIVVPMPAFPLDSLAAAYLTPPPPIICYPTPRDPSQPDPHLYKERPVACEPDNP